MKHSYRHLGGGAFLMRHSVLQNVKIERSSESTWKLYYADLLRLGFLPEAHDRLLHHKCLGFQLLQA